jgi:phosphoribosylaminoimidazole carboxylase (NCAIR synthetase)
MKKQTAVEWLQLKLNSVKPTDFCSIEKIKHWVNEAKAMEKQQIIEAYKIGYDEGLQIITKYENVEDYYTSTYGQ